MFVAHLFGVQCVTLVIATTGAVVAADAAVITVALFLDLLFHSYLFILVRSVLKCKAKLSKAGPKINNNKRDPKFIMATAVPLFLFVSLSRSFHFSHSLAFRICKCLLR